MPTTYPTLSLPAILFAHRGARAHAPENTLESFRLALRLGATGIASDVWRTADGVAVLDHDGTVGSRFRRRPIAELAREDLPDRIPSVAALYEDCGAAFELLLCVSDPDAVDLVLVAARDAGATARLWLCHPDLDVLARWREPARPARLVHTTRIAGMERGPEHHAARLRELGVDGVHLHHSEWSAGSVALFHRFGRYCLGGDAQHDRIIASLLDMGIDGVASDHVDRLVDAAAEIG